MEYDDDSFVDKLFSHKVRLFYSDQKIKKPLGFAIFYSSYGIVLKRLRYGFFLIVINSMIKTTLLWIIMVFFITKILGRPITSIIEQIKNLDFKKLKKLSQHGLLKNELLTLVDTFNSLIEEVDDYRDHLEEKVEERTKQLNESESPEDHGTEAVITLKKSA